MASKMGDHVLLVVAEEGDELVAGALNLIGGNAIFGRLWGCLPQVYYPSLHFEACYYQVKLQSIFLFFFYFSVRIKETNLNNHDHRHQFSRCIGSHD